MILVKLSPAEAERSKYCDKFLELTEKTNVSKIRLESKFKQFPVVSFGFTSSLPLLTATPGGAVQLDVKIINHLPKTLKNLKLHCCFKLCAQDGLRKPVAGRLPHFECMHSESDGINRFTCVWKGDITVRRESVQGFVGLESLSESQSNMFFRSLHADELSPGENIVTLAAAAAPEVGVYFFDFFELEIGRSLIVRCDWVDLPEIEIDLARRPVCFIHRKPVSVKLKPSTSE
ncbi:unnamed protein product [Gongylonema pulchrum]|uniref:Uncharacterized protein n=1 Tax=Gongylonema pulchrum TaxID=637853 RepID=A0A3P6Q0U0_9BILA|nr:unnamed protein product [Gongylonema pulchrum]